MGEDDEMVRTEAVAGDGGRVEEGVRAGGGEAVPESLAGNASGLLNRDEKAVHGGVGSGAAA